MDEVHATAAYAAEEKKMQVKKGNKRGKKRLVQEVVSQSKDNSSRVVSDPIGPVDIPGCLDMQ